MERLLRRTQCKLKIFIIRFIPKNFNAFVILEMEDKLCLELYTNIKSLGRITLRASGDTLAAGVVMEFIA
jgi:translation elongation factor EF-1alpha